VGQSGRRYVHLLGRVGRTKDAKGRRRLGLSLTHGEYARLEQLAVWERRTPAVMGETLMHLGFEVYEVLLERVAGKKGQLTLPEELPAIPSSEVLIEAVGRGMLAREAAARVEQRSREILIEQRREREAGFADA